MYQWKDFPESRRKEIRIETKCVYWHEERMLAISLLSEAKDQEDIKFLMEYDDYANVQLENARALCRKVVSKETDAWYKEEQRKSQEEWDSWKQKWKEDLKTATVKAIADLYS